MAAVMGLRLLTWRPPCAVWPPSHATRLAADFFATLDDPASFHQNCSTVLEAAAPETDTKQHQNPYSRSNFRIHEAARLLLAHASEAGSSTFAIVSIA